MKYLLFCLLIFSSLATHAQRYSSQISDASITDFMTWFFKNEDLKSEKYVAQKIQILMPYNFEYKSTTEYTYPFGNIFAHNKSLFEIFTKNDADFFVKQINNQVANDWAFQIKGVKLYDAIKAQFPKNQKGYFYSLPLFSSDKSMVMISAGYVINSDHGGGVYYLYKKRGNAWVKIKEFQKWEN